MDDFWCDKYLKKYKEHYEKIHEIINQKYYFNQLQPSMKLDCNSSCFYCNGIRKIKLSDKSGVLEKITVFKAHVPVAKQVLRQQGQCVASQLFLHQVDQVQSTLLVHVAVHQALDVQHRHQLRNE
jgi:hypothetical protein